MTGNAALLDVRGLEMAFPDRSRKPLVGAAPMRPVLKGVDLELRAGEAVGVVGESGSGKTTLGRALVRLHQPTAGTIRFDGQDVTGLPERQLRPLRRHMQMIFQDPLSSLNPRRRVVHIVAEPLLSFDLADSRRQALEQASGLLRKVGLSASLGMRFPHQLSGGQRQRVGIARAISVNPKFVVADEIVSGLDVSVQVQILDLLRSLRADMGLALLFISHDLSVVRTLCTRVLVMLEGEVVEEGACSEIFARPRHPYTRDLLAAIPLPSVEPEWLGDSAGYSGR